MDDFYKGYVLTYGPKIPETTTTVPEPQEVPQKISTGAVIRGQDSEDAPTRGRTDERKTALKWRRRRHKVG